MPLTEMLWGRLCMHSLESLCPEMIWEEREATILRAFPSGDKLVSPWKCRPAPRHQFYSWRTHLIWPVNNPFHQHMPEWKILKERPTLMWNIEFPNLKDTEFSWRVLIIYLNKECFPQALLHKQVCEQRQTNSPCVDI